MAKDKRKAVFNIAVVGLSGTEQIKGTTGAGKSCLCNRFVREEQDNYYPDHTSVLSQSDFGGRVVNNDHFLFWGEANKQDDNGIDYKFNIIEQTEFIDDQSYQAHRSSSNQLYYKRCAQTKISSAEKMMYICTDQLAIESDFETKPMPDGKLVVDGFILCFDVSHATNRTVDDQVRFVQNCYHYLAKTKKPILVALTKCDEAVSPYIKQGENFAASAGGKKGGGLPVVQTSASENINVTLAFLILAQLIDKSRTKSKTISFEDAAHVRKELLKDAKEQLENLLESQVSDYQESWQNARKGLVDKTQYLHFVDLEGVNAASKIFRKHVNRLRDEFRLQHQAEYLRYLPRALKIILPDVARIRTTWNDTLQQISSNKVFDNWIISEESMNLVGSGLPWYESEHMKSLEDRRIPYELLFTTEAERSFLMHRQELEAKQRRSEMKTRFRALLMQSPQVTPGREWGEVVKFFKQDFITELTEIEVSTIYEQFQAEIVDRAKEEFQELLYEKSDIFVANSNASTPMLDMDIHDALKSDPRYIAMSKLQKEREEILSRHISAVMYPPSDDWGAQCLSEALKHHRQELTSQKYRNNILPPSSRWQLKPDSDTLNVVLLGADGLSHELANEITVHSSEDEYTLDGCIHQLRLRSIDGNVLLLHNSFKTSSFSPHGCIAVYSSLESLAYIERSLENTVVMSPDATEAPPFQGLPVSILLASYSNSEKEVHVLRDAGERLASRIGCPFIDVLAPEYAYNRRFHESQIQLAMKSLIEGIKERAGSGRNSAADPDQAGGKINHEEGALPDLRVIMCTRKDELSTSEVALGPLLNHSSFRDPGEQLDEKEDKVAVETYLGTQRRKIAVTMTSYQSAKHLLSQGGAVHGFILVYDITKKSSLSIMKVFANNTVSSYPLLILCIDPVEDKSFFQQNAFAQGLITEGNKVADKLKAKFVIASPRHKRQTEVYTTFFKDAWEHKETTEAIHKIRQVVVDDDLEEAPIPAPRLRSGATVKSQSSSADNLTAKSLYEGPRPQEGRLETPPTSLPLNMSTQSSYTESHSEIGRSTPASTWSTGSDEYRPESPGTSPTASLIENEVSFSAQNNKTNPAYNETELKRTASPGGNNSHLYPSPSNQPGNQPSNQPSNQSAGNQPGKLNIDLLNKVAAGIKIQPPVNLELFTTSEQPYMTVHDPSRVRGQRVLPPEIPKKPQFNEHGVKIVALEPLHGESNPRLPRTAMSMINRRPPHHKPSKRQPLKSVDNDVTPTRAQTPPASLRPPRHSSTDLLSYNDERSTTPGLLRKGFASSHENLIHESPSVPASLFSGRASNAGFTPKEEKKLKAKEEERKKKEEKKVKEKETRMKYNKDKQKKLAPCAAVGNKHNISDYFNKKLDDIVQGLNHMVPLFVEKCVKFIEIYGIKTEGLYRIPANAKEREIVLRKFDEDNSFEFEVSEVSVSTVAGCLTWFFGHRNLPEPLIPHFLHDEFEEANAIPTVSLRNLAIRGIVRKLPYANYATFKFLCSHLKTVSDNFSENKMSSENLAICWWPTLFRPDVDSNPLNAVAGMTKTCHRDVLQTCIVQCQFMFFGQPEL